MREEGEKKKKKKETLNSFTPNICRNFNIWCLSENQIRPI